MKTIGIIAEYNPFHNGHAYHIRETRCITECDYLVVVMSGDYTQRGIPAFMPKHERAKIALMEGADLVLELPLTYATGTAERFAYGAVSLLNRLGCVDYLSFGCENDDLEMLQAIADLLIDPPAQLAEQILRNYTGVFSDGCFISIEQMALKTGMEPQQVEKVLGYLRNVGFHFVPARKEPRITFLRIRVPSEKLAITEASYGQRRQALEARIKEVVHYLQTDECRQAFISRYFGVESKACGYCDNCLKQRKTQKANG